MWSLSGRSIRGRGYFIFLRQRFKTYSRCQRFWSQSRLWWLWNWLAAWDDLEPLLFGQSRDSTRDRCTKSVWRQCWRCRRLSSCRCCFWKGLWSSKVSLQSNLSGWRELVITRVTHREQTSLTEANYPNIALSEIVRLTILRLSNMYLASHSTQSEYNEFL